VLPEAQQLTVVIMTSNSKVHAAPDEAQLSSQAPLLSPHTLPALGREESEGIRKRSKKWSKLKNAVEVENQDVVMMDERETDFCEGDPHAVIKVTRLGSHKGRLEVLYKTEGRSAKPKSDFIAVDNGVLVFEDGQQFAEIEIEIVQSLGGWEPIEDFMVHLTGIAFGNASLGWLDKTQVYIVDDDTYPPAWDKPEDDKDCKDPDVMNDLYHSFVRERLAHRWPKPRNTYIACAYLGAFSVLEAVLRGALLDYVGQRITQTKKEGRWTATVAQPFTSPEIEEWLYPVILCSIYAAATVLAWRCDRLQQDQRGNSGTRQDLRNFLIQKYLFLSENDHYRLRGHEFLNACVNQVEESVNKGWFMLCVLSRAVSLIFCSIAYMISKYYSSPEILVQIACVFLIMCLLMYGVLILRGPHNRELVQARQDSEDAWVGFIGNAIENWPLFKLYHLESESKLQCSSASAVVERVIRLALLVALTHSRPLLTFFSSPPRPSTQSMKRQNSKSAMVYFTRSTGITDSTNRIPIGCRRQL
jgi:hypothetical protein